MTDSKYQKDIYHNVKTTINNLVISSVAGSGKTTTLIKSVNQTPKEADKIFLAFNNSIVEELKQKIVYPNCSISTIHSICWRCLIRSSDMKLELKPNKSYDYSLKVVKNFKIPIKKQPYYSFIVSKVVDLARLNLLTEESELERIALFHGYDLEEEMPELILETLSLMNNDFKNYDFTDMVYRAAIDMIRMPTFDFVFVDECQDLSVLQHFIIKKLMKPNGRMIAVGDPNQAIYGFAGADFNSYKKLKNLFNPTKELPLSVSYRCAKRIVKEAAKVNDKILPFDLSDEGKVRNGFCKEIKINDWVLCRNLKPLIFLNLYLIDKGIRSSIRGVDIGQNLQRFVEKFKCNNVNSLFNKIDKDINEEITKMKSKGIKNPINTPKIDMKYQNKDILKILSYRLYTTKALIDKIKTIFKHQPNSVILSTIHKSKGLENDRIFFLCPELIPNKFATKDWQKKQEDNLKYVAITRAKKELIYINDFNLIEKKMLKKVDK